MKRFLLLLSAYLLALLLFWHIAGRLTPEQAIATSLLIAALFLTAICAAFAPRGKA